MNWLFLVPLAIFFFGFERWMRTQNQKRGELYDLAYPRLQWERSGTRIFKVEVHFPRMLMVVTIKDYETQGRRVFDLRRTNVGAWEQRECPSGTLWEPVEHWANLESAYQAYIPVAAEAKSLRHPPEPTPL